MNSVWKELLINMNSLLLWRSLIAKFIFQPCLTKIVTLSNSHQIKRLRSVLSATLGRGFQKKSLFHAKRKKKTEHKENCCNCTVNIFTFRMLMNFFNDHNKKNKSTKEFTWLILPRLWGGVSKTQYDSCDHPMKARYTRVGFWSCGHGCHPDLLARKRSKLGDLGFSFPLMCDRFLGSLLYLTSLKWTTNLESTWDFVISTRILVVLGCALKESCLETCHYQHVSPTNW